MNFVALMRHVLLPRASVRRTQRLPVSLDTAPHPSSPLDDLSTGTPQGGAFNGPRVPPMDKSRAVPPRQLRCYRWRLPHAPPNARPSPFAGRPPRAGGAALRFTETSSQKYFSATQILQSHRILFASHNFGNIEL